MTLRDKIIWILDTHHTVPVGTKDSEVYADRILDLIKRESNKAVIEELEKQNQHYLSKGGHLLLYDDDNGNPVYLSERLAEIKEQIGEE